MDSPKEGMFTIFGLPPLCETTFSHAIGYWVIKAQKVRLLQKVVFQTLSS